MKSQNDSSLAKLFWGRPQPHRLPIPKPKLPSNEKAEGTTSTNSKSLPGTRPLLRSYHCSQKIEDMALLADGSTAKWTKEVSITAVNPSGRSYEVQDSPSLTYTSGRELLKKESNAPTQNHPSFLNSRINKKKKKMQQCNYPEVHELDAR